MYLRLIQTREITSGKPGGSTQYKFNKDDEVTRIIDRNGRKRDFTYSDLGLPLTEKWRNADESLVRTSTWTYDDAGRVKTAEDPDSKYTYSYDIADEVVRVDN